MLGGQIDERVKERLREGGRSRGGLMAGKKVRGIVKRTMIFPLGIKTVKVQVAE